MPDFLIGLRMRQRYTLRPQTTGMLRGSRSRSVNGGFHAQCLGAATWKVREVSPPAAITARNQNRKVVLHDPL